MCSHVDSWVIYCKRAGFAAQVSCASSHRCNSARQMRQCLWFRCRQSWRLGWLSTSQRDGWNPCYGWYSSDVVSMSESWDPPKFPQWPSLGVDISLYFQWSCVLSPYKYIYMWNLDEALLSPLPGKQTKGSGVSTTHCVYATPWSQKRGRHFGSLSFLRQYCGPVFGAGFGPIFGTTKEQTGAARRSWRPGFRPFAGSSFPSATQAAMDTHTRIILWGGMAQKLFWISEKGPLSGAARIHANLLRSGSVPPLQRFC